MSNEHIPTEEVIQDIADTEAEIRDLKREEEALRMLGDRMSMFKADHRRHGIEERKVFISKLNKILDERKPAQARQE